jgi:hypothetical protein
VGAVASNKQVAARGLRHFYNRAMLRTLDDYTLTSNALLVDTNNAAAERLLTELKFPTVLAANDQRVRSWACARRAFCGAVSSDFRIPVSYQAALGVEHEVRRGMKLELNYVFNRGIHLVRER